MFLDAMRELLPSLQADLGYYLSIGECWNTLSAEERAQVAGLCDRLYRQRRSIGQQRRHAPNSLKLVKG